MGCRVGRGQGLGGTPGMGLPLPPAWHGRRGHPTQPHPIPSHPVLLALAQPCCTPGLWRGQSRDGAPCCSPPARCLGVSPCPIPPPAPCHWLGPGQRGPVTGGSSPGPGHDLRGDLEQVPAGTGDRLCLSSRAGTLLCSPQGNSEQQHHCQTALTTALKLKKFLFLPLFQ